MKPDAGELVLEHRDLAVAMAWRWRDAPDWEDLVQVGLIGLWQAAKRWTPQRGPFRRFAAKRVRGAILDEIRLRRGRGVWKSAAAGTLMIRGEHVDVEELRRRLAHVSLSLPLREGGETTLLERLGDVDDELERAADVDEAVQAWELIASGLSDRLRFVLWLRYVEELSLVEAGNVLGVTESRVSQLEQKAIAQARKLAA